MRFSYEVPGFRAACTVRVVRSGILDAASLEELADAPVRVDGDSLVWELEVAPRQLFGAVVRVELELNDAVLEPMRGLRRAARGLGRGADALARRSARV